MLTFRDEMMGMPNSFSSDWELGRSRFRKLKNSDEKQRGWKRLLSTLSLNFCMTKFMGEIGNRSGGRYPTR